MTTDSKSAAKVLLLDADQEGAKHIARVLRPALEEVEILSKVEEVQRSDGWSLLLANYDHLDMEQSESLFGLCKGDRKLLLYSSRSNRGEFADLFGRFGLMNLLAKSPEVDGAELLVTMQKLLRNDVFGLHKYFPWGVPTQRFTVRRASLREQTIDSVCAFGADVKAPRRLVELYRTVADELITNAIYNAPVDANGHALYGHLPRTEEVELAADQEIKVTTCCDGQKLGISVEDPFGSIQQGQVLDYLSKCFRKGTDQVDTKEGGAGLGLYYVFESLSHFVVNLAPGKRTEMLGLLDIRGSYRDFTSKPKSFNIFVEK